MMQWPEYIGNARTLIASGETPRDHTAEQRQQRTEHRDQNHFGVSAAVNLRLMALMTLPRPGTC